MYGCRTVFGVGCFSLFVALGCGGSMVHGVEESGPGGSGGGGASPSAGGAGARPGVGGQSQAGSGGVAGSTAGSGGAAEPDPIDGGCPDVDRPPPDLQCDPFVLDSCGPGAACYPFVTHPEGGGCEQQRYGTTCAPAGTGKQGSLCGGGFGDEWCAPGFVCVVGQGAGKRCAALCELGSTKQCGGGLICGELDVAGFGVCG
jgi:hypothetical protein